MSKIVCKLRHEEKTQEFAYCHSFTHTRFTPTILNKLTETESKRQKNSFGEKKNEGRFPHRPFPTLVKEKKVRKSKKTNCDYLTKNTFVFYFSIISCTVGEHEQVCKSLKRTRKKQKVWQKFFTFEDILFLNNSFPWVSLLS